MEELDDFDYEKVIKEKKRNLELFEKIVGINPFDQIDYIIKYGSKKYNHWWRCCELGTIYSPATVKEYIEIPTEYFEVRGGRGNNVIYTWGYYDK